MTQEEKAKAYDEAIKKAKDALNDGTISNNTIAYLQDIFSELKESEDERIRKDLIAFLEDIFYFGKNTNLDKWDKSDCSDWIAWLEKKREKKQEWSEDDENEFNHIIHILNLAEEEQEIKGYNNLIGTVDWFKSLKDKVQSKQSNKPQGKPVLETVDEKSTDNANNVQPKFKVGDWIVYDDNICKIMKMSPDYQFYHCYSIKNHLHIYNRSLENEIHLWTINDAKDGDIIYAKSKFNDFYYICIFFKLENGKSWDHCYITSKDSKHWNFEYGKGFLRIDGHDFYPASKEQRDLLFYKMKESDYEWDFKNKEVTPLF